MREVAAGVAVLAAACLVAAGSGDSAPPAAAQGGGASAKPNVVVVMSDDQTQASMAQMPRTQSLLGDRGTTFANNFTNWPLCCPSRATYLTGQYAHNHQVLGNAPPQGGFDRLNLAETLPVWLQRSGYYTAHIGKFLNGYESSAIGVPDGWSEWHGSKRTYTFYGYQLLEDGQINTYGSTNFNPDAPANPALYSTDVYTDKAVELIGRRAPERQPFFLSVAYLAPHSGGPNAGPNETESRCETTAKPALRHIGAFGSEPLPTPPNFNEADVADKPQGLATRPALTEAQIAETTRDYRCRLESLLAIDEGIERIVNALEASGELDNTVFVYTADNGFFHGEHRIMTGKNRVYDEAIRVPMLIRGPGVAEGKTVTDLSANADIAPTVLDAAGATAGLAVDGRSLLPSAKHPERLRGRELLVEQYTSADDEGGIPGVVYSAVRNARYAYVENGTGEVELYDMELDPFQLTNVAGNPVYAAARAALAARLASLRTCTGPGCRQKPSLKLKLPRSQRENGRSCRSAKDFLARVRGPDSATLTEVTFRVGAKLDSSDRAGPFTKILRPKLLRRGRKPEIRAIAETLDGRALSLQKAIRICD